MVIHTGDLFHTARVSDKFAGQVSEMIKGWKIPVYVVPGNHDIEGYTVDTIDQTKLGLLAKAGVINILDRNNPITINVEQNNKKFSVAISGQEYYAHIDEGNMDDFEMQQPEADFNILAIHGYIADTPQHPNIKCTMCNDIVSDADVILAGHYHRQFEWSDGQNLDIFNPGSMMRVEQNEYNRTHIPQYGICDIHLNSAGDIEWSYTFNEFKIASPSDVVFDYNSKYKAKNLAITLDGFKTSIENSISQIQMNTNIQCNIHTICAASGTDRKIEQKAINIYNNALQSTPEKFEVQPGYIQSQKNKIIDYVTLTNFQSHKNTTIHFDEGLNIIVGESNSGKTAILRSIMWAIDNQPLGNDFIMAGEDECSVLIMFKDGSFIERKRTIKDTGSYKIGFCDNKKNMVSQTFRGFTNAIPVGVANTHQMPKVNITKDIETHLNVISQLEGPFLLTESPLVKASAIGRITGTHIIDTAIKESNKTIQSNRKLIKSYSDDLQDKESEYKQLPNLKLMEELLQKYNTTVKYITKLNDIISKVSNNISLITQYNQQIKVEEDNITNNKKILSLFPIINRAIDKLKNVSYIFDNVNKHHELSLQIVQNKIKLDKSMYFNNLKPLVEVAISKCNIIDKVNYAITKVDEYNTLISVNKNTKQSLEVFYTNMNKVISYCKTLTNRIDILSLKTENIAKLNVYEDELITDADAMKHDVEVLKLNIESIKQEQNKYILEHGKCPCCGQNIHDSHINSIVNFFKEVKYET